MEEEAGISLALLLHFFLKAQQAALRTESEILAVKVNNLSKRQVCFKILITQKHWVRQLPLANNNRP